MTSTLWLGQLLLQIVEGLHGRAGRLTSTVQGSAVQLPPSLRLAVVRQTRTQRDSSKWRIFSRIRIRYLPRWGAVAWVYGHPMAEKYDLTLMDVSLDSLNKVLK